MSAYRQTGGRLGAGDLLITVAPVGENPSGLDLLWRVLGDLGLVATWVLDAPLRAAWAPRLLKSPRVHEVAFAYEAEPHRGALAGPPVLAGLPVRTAYAPGTIALGDVRRYARHGLRAVITPPGVGDFRSARGFGYGVWQAPVTTPVTGSGWNARRRARRDLRVAADEAGYVHLLIPSSTGQGVAAGGWPRGLLDEAANLRDRGMLENPTAARLATRLAEEPADWRLGAA